MVWPSSLWQLGALAVRAVVALMIASVRRDLGCDEHGVLASLHLVLRDRYVASRVGATRMKGDATPR